MSILVHGAALAVVAFTLAASPPIDSASPAPPASSAYAVGAPAPPFRLSTIDGKTLSLADFRGKTLVVNVWGSWCPPCRLETPDLVAESAAMRAQGVVFLGVDTTETAAVVRAYAAEKSVPYEQVATTGKSDFARDYDITNFPTTIVIDPSGVVRAIHADNILPRPQLHAYVVAAKAGQTAPLETAEQQKLDAMLDPSHFDFESDATTALASVHSAATAIGAAEDEMDDAMIDPARDHDLLKTHAEEAALRAQAVAALQADAQAPADRALLDRMVGDGDVASGRSADAISSYQSALAIDDHDRDALSGLAYAESQSGDDKAVLAIDQRIVASYPSFATEISLARANATLGDRQATLAAIDAAIPLAEKASPAALAWTHLYAGRSAVKVSDATRARVEFLAAEAAAARIPRGDPRYAWYLEQSQEALLALDLAGSQPTLGLSIAPWTGPELPGSVASTYKYRLALSGRPGSSVRLKAIGLPDRWIGSFCSDRVCSPFTVSTTIPASGVKVVEFQVIPEGTHKSGHPTVSVIGSDGSARISATTVVNS